MVSQKDSRRGQTLVTRQLSRRQDRGGTQGNNVRPWHKKPARPGRVRLLKKELFQIIPMHMMTREIISGRKTEGSTVSSINCVRL